MKSFSLSPLLIGSEALTSPPVPAGLFIQQVEPDEDEKGK